MSEKSDMDLLEFPPTHETFVMGDSVVHLDFGGPFWQFEGWVFEYNPGKYMGPWPVNKDLDLRKTPPGRKFFAMFDRWTSLSASEKQATLVEINENDTTAPATPKPKGD